ncbi:hypothetical protein J1614_011685 [Plenodomus biglobosus]|nr:hypothetical protein J1614_011685 [Plenodomus biglobosus]
MTDIRKIKKNWRYVLAAGMTVASIIFAAVLVYTCRRHRKRGQNDLENSGTDKTVPVKLFRFSSEPRNLPLRPATWPTESPSDVAFNWPILPTGSPWEGERNYNFEESMRTYGEQFRQDQELDRHLLPSLSTAPVSRSATDCLIVERLSEIGRPGFPYSQTPKVHR